MATVTRDFYAVLAVARTASPDEIQRAYRALARTYHPDVNQDPSAEERFKEVGEAYGVLSDPDTRRRYDAFGPDFRQVPDGTDPRTSARVHPVGDGIDLDDLLGGMFGEPGRAGSGWSQIPGADQESELALSVEDAYRGDRRPITVPHPDGPRTFEVAIPPGITDGQRIRLAGQGGPGGGGSPAGDLYLVIRLAPHPRYRVEGRDVHVALPVAPWEAALGVEIPLAIPGGETTVRVPPGTSSGARLRLAGRGLPNPRGQPGDVLAEVTIVIPPHLSEAERRLFEQLAATSTFDPRNPR